MNVIYLAALLPIALYLVALRILDVFSMARPAKLASYLLWGISCTLIAYGISLIWRDTHHGQGWSAVWVSPVIEECIKVLPLIVMVKSRRVVFLAETMVYGMMIGGGFALAENILFLIHIPQMTLGTAIVRGLGTSMLHMGCTSTIATLLLLGNKFHAVASILATVIALVPSIAIHSLHNMHLFQPMIQLLVVVVCFLGIFLLLGNINEKSTLKWLDISIQNDVGLLASLKSGTLMDTPTGEYLKSIKNRFEPLVFFDMCVYLQLYLELLMKGKSRLMLHDAGIDIPLSEQDKKQNNEQKLELKTISRRIPMLGHELLRPLIHQTDKDKWAIERINE